MWRRLPAAPPAGGGSRPGARRVGDAKALSGTWQGARADVAGDARRVALTARATREDASEGGLGRGAGRIAAMCARSSATCEPLDTGAWPPRPGRRRRGARRCEGDVALWAKKCAGDVAGAAGDQPAGWPRLVEAGARRLEGDVVGAGGELMLGGQQGAVLVESIVHLAVQDDDVMRGDGPRRLAQGLALGEQLGVAGDERLHGEGERGFEQREGRELGLEGEVFGARPGGAHRRGPHGGVGGASGGGLRRAPFFFDGRGPGPLLRSARFLLASAGNVMMCAPSMSRSIAGVTWEEEPSTLGHWSKPRLVVRMSAPLRYLRATSSKKTPARSSSCFFGLLPSSSMMSTSGLASSSSVSSSVSSAREA